MGDFNDHTDAAALAPFLNSGLNFEFKRDDRGEAFTTSYSFNGVRKAIDHLVIGSAEVNATATCLNLNADDLDQLSDHNPVVLEIGLEN